MLFGKCSHKNKRKNHLTKAEVRKNFRESTKSAPASPIIEPQTKPEDYANSAPINELKNQIVDLKAQLEPINQLKNQIADLKAELDQLKKEIAEFKTQSKPEIIESKIESDPEQPEETPIEKFIRENPEPTDYQERMHWGIMCARIEDEMEEEKRRKEEEEHQNWLHNLPTTMSDCDYSGDEDDYY